MCFTGIHKVTQEIRKTTAGRKIKGGEEKQQSGSHYLGPFLAQQHNDAQVARRCGIAQRRQATFGRGIHIGPKLQQQGHHFCVTEMRLDT